MTELLKLGERRKDKKDAARRDVADRRARRSKDAASVAVSVEPSADGAKFTWRVQNPTTEDLLEVSGNAYLPPEHTVTSIVPPKTLKPGGSEWTESALDAVSAALVSVQPGSLQCSVEWTDVDGYRWRLAEENPVACIARPVDDPEV